MCARGHLAACGTLDDLCGSYDGEQLFLRVEDAAGDWPAHTSTVTSFRTQEDGVLVKPAPGNDENDVLRAAMKHGRVRQIDWRRPTLTQLFRELVQPMKGGVEA